MHADRHVWLEAVLGQLLCVVRSPAACRGPLGWALLAHADSNHGVAEEDCSTGDGENEEDMDFLAETFDA